MLLYSHLVGNPRRSGYTREPGSGRWRGRRRGIARQAPANTGANVNDGGALAPQREDVIEEGDGQASLGRRPVSSQTARDDKVRRPPPPPLSLYV